MKLQLFTCFRKVIGIKHRQLFTEGLRVWMPLSSILGGRPSRSCCIVLKLSAILSIFDWKSVNLHEWRASECRSVAWGNLSRMWCETASLLHVVTSLCMYNIGTCVILCSWKEVFLMIPHFCSLENPKQDAVTLLCLFFLAGTELWNSLSYAHPAAWCPTI